MSKTIVDYADQLHTKGITGLVLKSLDWAVPGEYHNVTGFTNMVRHYSGETDEAFIQRVGDRAIALYNDRSQGYIDATFTYRTVDEIGERAGQLAMASEATENIGFLKWLDKLTPKSESVQQIDLALKLAGEMVAFLKLNGMPGENIGDFVESLSNMTDERAMRMAALVAIDGVLPLGPDFLGQVTETLRRFTPEAAGKNDRFQKMASLIPGAGTGDKIGYLQQGLGQVGGWMSGFVQERGITQDKVLGAVERFVGNSDRKLDYLAAFLDFSCRYYEHTGIQSVTRALVMRAVNEV